MPDGYCELHSTYSYIKPPKTVLLGWVVRTVILTVVYSKATPRVCADICEGFGIPQSGLFKTPSYREK